MADDGGLRLRIEDGVFKARVDDGDLKTTVDDGGYKANKVVESKRRDDGSM